MEKTRRSLSRKLIAGASAVAALLLCAGAGLHAAQGQIDQCVDRLEKTYSAMQDYQARFSQETRQASLDMVQHGSGSVYFKKGGKMRWSYTAPEAQEIILDGQNLWVYLPGQKQVMKNNFSVVPSHIVVDLFRGSIDIQQKFTVSFVERVVDTTDPSVAIQLVPVVYNPALTRLTLWLDPKTSLVRASCLEDEFGTRTTLRFSDVSVDAGIDDARFSFVPPPDVEIFEPPQIR